MRDLVDMNGARSQDSLKLFNVFFFLNLSQYLMSGSALAPLQGKCQGYRRRHRISSFRPVEDITEEDLENVAITVRDKIYDKVLVRHV